MKEALRLFIKWILFTTIILLSSKQYNEWQLYALAVLLVLLAFTCYIEGSEMQEELCNKYH